MKYSNGVNVNVNDEVIVISGKLSGLRAVVIPRYEISSSPYGNVVLRPLENRSDGYGYSPFNYNVNHVELVKVHGYDGVANVETKTVRIRGQEWAADEYH
jgi:ribosomal protein L24